MFQRYSILPFLPGVFTDRRVHVQLTVHPQRPFRPCFLLIDPAPGPLFVDRFDVGMISYLPNPVPAAVFAIPDVSGLIRTELPDGPAILLDTEAPWPLALDVRTILPGQHVRLDLVRPTEAAGADYAIHAAMAGIYS